MLVVLFYVDKIGVGDFDSVCESERNHLGQIERVTLKVMAIPISESDVENYAVKATMKSV